MPIQIADIPMLLDIFDHVDRHSILPPDIVSSTNEYRQFTKLFCKRFQITFDMRHAISRIASTSATDVRISSLQEMQQQQRRSRNMKTARTTTGKTLPSGGFATDQTHWKTLERNAPRTVFQTMRKHARSRLRHIIQRLGERRQLRIEQTCGLQIVESYDTCLSNRSSTCNAPAAILSECAKTPSTCGYSAIIRSMDLRPLSIS